MLLVIAESGHKNISPYGIAGVASLAGMFSKQATDKLREVFDSLFKAEGDKERSDKLWEEKPVTAEMIRRNQIQHHRLKQDGDESEVTLHELFGPRVTRVPVFRQHWSLRCLIHQSLLHKFITEASVKTAQQASPQPYQIKDHTLAEFLDDSVIRAMVEDTNAYVGPEATLADAKAAIESIDGCQDVFITESGNAEGAVFGPAPRWARRCAPLPNLRYTVVGRNLQRYSVTK